MTAILTLVWQIVQKIPRLFWYLLIAAIIGGIVGYRIHKPPVIRTGTTTTQTVTLKPAPQVAIDSAVVARAFARFLPPVYIPVPAKPLPGRVDTLHNTSTVYAVALPPDAAPVVPQTHCLSISKKFPRGDSVYAEICSALLPLTLPADFRSEIYLQRAPDTVHNSFRVDTVPVSPGFWAGAKKVGIGAVIGAAATMTVIVLLKGAL